MVDLTVRYQRLTRRYADAAGQAAAQAWDRLNTFDAPDELARLARPAVTTLSSRAAAATHGYLGILLEEGITVPPVLAAPDWDSALIALRRSLAEGHEWEQALASGRLRSEAVGSNAVIGSTRLSSEITSPRVAGWRRITSAKSCDWCQTVATGHYYTAESAHFGHDHCHCTVAPIVGESDPGRALNNQTHPEPSAER
jgi:hypothetical protein